MSTPEQPVHGHQATFEAQVLHVDRLPDENLAVLRRVEYQVLRDGEVNEAKAGRDLCVGFFASAIIGLVGLVATIDWGAAIRQALKAPFIFTAILLVISAASACGALICHQRYTRTKKNSAYSDLMKRLAEHFAKQNPPG